MVTCSQRMKLSFRALVCVLTCTVPRLAHTQSAIPLTAKDLIAARSIDNIAVSPDGKWIAYTTALFIAPAANALDRFFTRRGVARQIAGTSLNVVDVKTGQSFAMGGEGITTWGPSWAPDGRTLAFYSDADGYARLWIWEAGALHPRRLSAARIRTLYEDEIPQWGGRGTVVIAKVLPDDLEARIAKFRVKTSNAVPVSGGGAQVKVLRSSFSKPVSKPSTPDAAGPAGDTLTVVPRPRGSEGNPWEWGDISAIDVRTGRIRQISEGGSIWRFTASPDGRRVAWTRFLGDRPVSFQRVGTLMSANVDGTNKKALAEQVLMLYGASVAWSPSSTYLAYATAGTEPRNTLYVVRADGSAPARTVSPGIAPTLDDDRAGYLLQWAGTDSTCVFLARNALWRADLATGTSSVVPHGSSLAVQSIVSAQSGTATVVARDSTNAEGIYSIDLRAGRVEPLLSGARSVGKARKATGADLIAFRSEDAAHPQDVWAGPQHALQSATRITHANAVLDKYEFGNSQLIQWRSNIGDVLHGTLVLPVGYTPGRRYPMVVYIYGTRSFSRSINTFGSSGTLGNNPQMMATRGYAVLLPDAPLRREHAVEDLLGTIMPGVDEAVRLGIADSTRLSVWGHSYGGYSVAALVSHTTRFKAAIAGAGMANLLSAYFRMGDDGLDGAGYFEKGQAAMDATPWEAFDRYKENSPIFAFDRVQTPMLIYAGALDVHDGSNEMFMALRRLGKEAELRIYGGETHWIQMPDNLEDFWTRVFEWIGR